MTLEQAIEFCLNIEKEQYKSAHNTIIGDYPEYEAASHFRLASEYKQIAELLTELKELKASGVKPVKRGQWIEKPPYKDETVKGLEFQIVCSECDEQNCSIEFDEYHNPIGKTFYKTRFCPNCGAEMNH